MSRVSTERKSRVRAHGGGDVTCHRRRRAAALRVSGPARTASRCCNLRMADPRIVSTPNCAIIACLMNPCATSRCGAPISTHRCSAQRRASFPMRVWTEALASPCVRQRARLPSPFRSVLGLRSLNTHRPRYPNRGVRTEDLRSSLLSAFSLVQRSGLCPKRQPRLLIS